MHLQIYSFVCHLRYVTAIIYNLAITAPKAKRTNRAAEKKNIATQTDSFFHMLNSHFRCDTNRMPNHSELGTRRQTRMQIIFDFIFILFLSAGFALMSLIFASSSMSRCVADGIYLNMNKNNRACVCVCSDWLAAGERLAVVPWRRAAKSILMKFHAYFVFIHFLWFYYVLPFSFHRFDVIRFAHEGSNCDAPFALFCICLWFLLRFFPSLYPSYLFHYRRRRSRSTSTEWNIIFHTRYVTSTCVCESCALYYGLNAATAQEHYLRFRLLAANNNSTKAAERRRRSRGKKNGNQQEYIHDDMVK